MHLDFTMQDDEHVGKYVLFDPAAVKHLQDWDILEAVEREASLGNLVLLDWEDAELKCWLYVDEEPPDRVLRNAENRHAGLLLRAPSGQLKAAGLVSLAKDGVGSARACVCIAPGDCRLDVYEVDAFADAPEMSDGYADFGTAGCLGTLLLLPTSLILVIFGCWKLAAASTGALSLYWMAQRLWWHFGGVRRRQQAWEKVLSARWDGKEPPQVVMVIRSWRGQQMG